MRHGIEPKHTPRGVTPRRLKASERALKRERENHPLFSDQVAEVQPTATERIETIDARFGEGLQGMRDLTAKHWKWGRAQLEAHPEHREEILAAWEKSFCPPNGTYFADFVRSRLKRKGIELD